VSGFRHFDRHRLRAAGLLPDEYTQGGTIAVGNDGF
jgi:hypothetical protein